MEKTAAPYPRRSRRLCRIAMALRKGASEESAWKVILRKRAIDFANKSYKDKKYDSGLFLKWVTEIKLAVRSRADSHCAFDKRMEGQQPYIKPIVIEAYLMKVRTGNHWQKANGCPKELGTNWMAGGRQIAVDVNNNVEVPFDKEHFVGAEP